MNRNQNKKTLGKTNTNWKKIKTKNIRKTKTHE